MRSKTIKTRQAVLLAALLLAVLTLGFMPWHFVQTTLDRRVMAAIHSSTGLTASASQGVHVALLPTPRIILTDASLENAAQGLSMRSPRVRSDVRLLPLLAGRIEFDQIDLVSPQIDLRLADDAEPLATFMALINGLSAPTRPLPRIIMRDGSLFVRDSLAITTTMRNISGLVSARERDEPLALAASLRWRGEDVQLSGEWPARALPDQRSAAVTARLKSELLNLRFDGTSRPRGPGQTEGQTTGKFEIETPSLPRALAWMGEATPFSVIADQLRIAGDLTLAGSEYVSPALSLVIDGERLDGTLMLLQARDGRMALSGTLAGARLDLDRIIQRLEPQRHLSTGDRSGTTVDISTVTARDIDVRLSLDAARLGGARLEKLAIQLMSTRDRIDANLLQASAYKGNVKARISMMATGISAEARIAGTELKLSGAMDKVDLALAAADLSDGRRISGTAFGQVNAEGNGESLQEAISALKGRANLLVRQGEINGISLIDILRRAERQPLAALREFRTGRTGFDVASFSGNIVQGGIELAEGQVAAPGFRLALSGRISLLDRNLGLVATVSNLSGSMQLPFEISGPWTDLQISPDAGALIRRSGAAAPLFQLQ
jgi:AsmA protein